MSRLICMAARGCNVDGKVRLQPSGGWSYGLTFQSGWRWWTCWSAVLLALTVQPGCVRRRMTIRTDPPGATVYVDQREIGTSPVSTSFTYYGTRNFVIMKDGYQTVQASRTFHPPWYQWPVVDFVMENLWPREIRDERIVEFQLAAKPQVSPERLIQRAEDVRRSAASGVVSPLPSVASGGMQPPAPVTAVPAQGAASLPQTVPPPSGPSVPQSPIIRPPTSF